MRRWSALCLQDLQADEGFSTDQGSTTTVKIEYKNINRGWMSTPPVCCICGQKMHKKREGFKIILKFNVSTNKQEASCAEKVIIMVHSIIDDSPSPTKQSPPK